MLLAVSCTQQVEINEKQPVNMNKLNSNIDDWHISAGKANFEDYFKITGDKFVFLGTAPGERWTKGEFMSFCKPYFDKGQAWDFKPSNRVWEFNQDSTVAWFDEDLDTWMKGCRGSGVIEYANSDWKLQYYNLTVLIENEKINEFISLREQPLND